MGKKLASTKLPTVQYKYTCTTGHIIACKRVKSWQFGVAVIRDTRCFLENGATAAHLFVSEDLRVGETVGVLAVLGDPGLQGDIDLRLQELDSPVAFSPHSRNLTLTRPLDKEGIDGPASVYVNVICERKHTLDPGFVIPVNIRVTDANDNAPQFVNAPYVLNISEVSRATSNAIIILLFLHGGLNCIFTN